MRWLVALLALTVAVPCLFADDSICPRCGKQWTEEMNFCGSCGTPMKKGLVQLHVRPPRTDKVLSREDYIARSFLKTVLRSKPYPGAMSSRIHTPRHVMDYKVIKKFREDTSRGQAKFRYGILVQTRRDDEWHWVEMVLRVQTESVEKVLLFCRRRHAWARWRNCMELMLDKEALR